MGLGLALKYYRLKRGVRQKDLARRVGTSPAHLSLVETGRRSASIRLLEQIAAELRVPVELLLFEARHDEKNDLSPQQMELFDQAKRLMILAAQIENENTVENRTKASSAAEHPKSTAPRPTTRRTSRPSQKSDIPPGSSLRSNTAGKEERRTKNPNDHRPKTDS